MIQFFYFVMTVNALLLTRTVLRIRTGSRMVIELRVDLSPHIELIMIVSTLFELMVGLIEIRTYSRFKCIQPFQSLPIFLFFLFIILLHLLQNPVVLSHYGQSAVVTLVMVVRTLQFVIKWTFLVIITAVLSLITQRMEHLFIEVVSVVTFLFFFTAETDVGQVG